jgi:dephospho-CoA kinase
MIRKSLNIMKLILGFVGEIASGKGTATKYLVEKYGASSHRFSTPIRKVCEILHLEQSRANLQKISETLRANIGEDIFAKILAKEAEQDTNEIVVIDGIRRPDDIKYLKKLPNFHVVNVAAEEVTRYNRLVERRENPDDADKTLEQFRTQAEEEPERKIREVASQADFVIDNNGALENTQQQLDDLITKLK